MGADNVCIQKFTVDHCGGTATKYGAVRRYKYSPVELFTETKFWKLGDAVSEGRRISESEKLQLVVSVSLFGRSETEGIPVL